MEINRLREERIAESAFRTEKYANKPGKKYWKCRNKMKIL
jgi:hypothetical protein